MKATDLMIGDWLKNVLFNEFEQVNYLEDNNINGHPTDWYELTPLTPEILEKNGLFVKHPDSEKRQYWRDSTGQLVVHKNRGYFLFNISGNAFKFGYFVPQFSAHLRYVHELQHALKLCGIDKEILL